MTEAGHYTELYQNSHFPPTVEVWCPTVDNEVVMFHSLNINHCPVCGVEVDPP